jgi:hypothetical protein
MKYLGLAAYFLWIATAGASSANAIRPIPDGTYTARLDPDQQAFVPARRAMGTAFVVPSKKDFDSVRVGIILFRKSVPIGKVAGGIMYWRNDQCVIAFDSVEASNASLLPGRGYFNVSSLELVPTPGGGLHPGEALFVPGWSKREWRVTVDHTLTIPSDRADDDGD